MRALIRLFLLPFYAAVTTAHWLDKPERPWHITWLLVVDYFERHPPLCAHVVVYNAAAYVLFGLMLAQ